MYKLRAFKEIEFFTVPFTKLIEESLYSLGSGTRSNGNMYFKIIKNRMKCGISESANLTSLT